ncbi:MAG: hypothetical protein ACRYG7_14925 [Janthinobacterium lividum]
MSSIGPTLQLTLATGQVLAVSLNLHTITDRKLLVDIATAQRGAEKEAEIANRTYHMGQKSSPDLDYDNRLTTRLGCCSKTAYAYLELLPHKGGLRHIRLGKKYHITERDVRRFEGESVN